MHRFFLCCRLCLRGLEDKEGARWMKRNARESAGARK